MAKKHFTGQNQRVANPGESEGFGNHNKILQCASYSDSFKCYKIYQYLDKFQLSILRIPCSAFRSSAKIVNDIFKLKSNAASKPEIQG